ncbi:hypothetical protein K470DRAFT_271393 [Piedraia hortae CBS 480.64]|uniref:DUF803-domain-containing protein n=1 Tax=Piedraia hortae CBS 480.64 TaxID=1314780 RepID=A0A6A7BY90_9PEZI|nr:hypothetical protein K470DRAFT_271393 [Piedraia hortae CBS 480.64]
MDFSDSDSDDEGFSNTTQGSGIFLPGGLNVPLPKGCGALFAPTGQLLTFFATKPRPPVIDFAAARRRPVARKILRLFPDFGNLSNEVDSADEEMHSDSTNSITCDQPAEEWKMPPPRNVVGEPPHRHAVVVRDYALTAASYPSRLVAKSYRLFCLSKETVSGLCMYNAAVADQASREDTAEIWRVAALVLADAHARDYKMSTAKSEQAKVQWGNHPLGRSWLVGELLHWAKNRADVQLLAYLTAVLSLADDPKTKGLKASIKPRQGRVTDNIVIASPSPTKLAQYTSGVSRWTESTSSTPAILQSRRTSKTTGSGSPEYSRGSFSATARRYAQNITDKLPSHDALTSYVRKIGGSSASNEPFFNLPHTTEGWNKTVSFADDPKSHREEKGTEVPGEVRCRLLNVEAFSTTSNFMPESMEMEAESWRGHYAEQLRCWELWTQASELDQQSSRAIVDFQEEVYGVEALSPKMLDMGLIQKLSPEAGVVIGVIVGLLSTCIQSVGMTMQRKSHVLEGDRAGRNERPAWKRRRWQIGMLLFLVANVVGSSIQITMLPLPLLSTLQASGLVFNSVLASLLLHEKWTWRTTYGTGLVAIGAVLISLFSAIPERSHDLEQLMDLLSRRTFLIWFILSLILVAILLVTDLTLRMVVEGAETERTYCIRGMGYGAISGILSAHALLLAKSAVELLVRSIADGKSQFHDYRSWLIPVAFLVLALSQLYYLHLGLRLISTSLLYPFVFCVYNVVAILDGLIYFRQASQLPVSHAVLIAVGTIILLSGVLALSWRLQEAGEEIPQTVLTPGLGFIGDQSEDDSEDQTETDEEAGEIRPLLRHTTSSATSQTIKRRRGRASTLKEVINLWNGDHEEAAVDDANGEADDANGEADAEARTSTSCRSRSGRRWRRRSTHQGALFSELLKANWWREGEGDGDTRQGR